MGTNSNVSTQSRGFCLFGRASLLLALLAATSTFGQQSDAPPAPVVQDVVVESSTSIFLRWTVDTDSGVSDQEISESRITWQVAGSQTSESMDIAVNAQHCEDTTTYPIRCSATLTGLAVDTSYELSLSAHGVTYESGTTTIETDYGFGESSAATTRQTHDDYALADPVLAGIEKQARVPFVKIVNDNSETASSSLDGLFTFLSERGSDATTPSNPHLWDYTATVSPTGAARLSIVIDFDSRVEDDLFRIVGTYTASDSTTARATVTATSKNDSAVKAKRDIVFTVIRNRAPVFGVTAATFEMSEDNPYPIETGDRFNVSDADDHTLSYTVETIEPDQEIFEIDADTGTISLKDGEELDYETAVQHVLHVRAIDSVGAESNVLKVTIDVLNVDEGPSGPSDAVDMGSLVHQNMGFDEDWVNFHVRDYFYDPDGDNLCYDAEITKGSAYATVSVSSNDSGCGLPHIQVRRISMTGLYEVKEVEVEITATEDIDEDPGSVTAKVTVSVVYGENVKPSILGGKLPGNGASSAYLVAYDAGTESSFDMIFTALDTLPRKDRVCFTLSGRDASQFKLVDVDNPNQTASCELEGSNSTQGSLSYSHQVRVQSIRSLERTKSNPTYSFELIATDLSGYADSLDFEISTDNIWSGLFSYAIPDAYFLAGDDPKTYALGDYFDHDEDDEKDNLTFDVKSGNVDLVEAYEYDGELTLTPTRSLNRSRASTYVTVLAEDSDGFATRERFDVHLRQENNSPRIDRVVRSYSIPEDYPLSQYFSKAPHAYDSDDDEITFRLADADWPFHADANTGLITVVDRLDFETATSYRLTLYAEDDYGGSDSVKISIDVTDVNEAPTPTDVVLDDTETIVGLGLKNEILSTDHFSDQDAGDSVTIAIHSSRSKVATAELDADGYIEVEGLEPGETTITIDATDSGNPPLTSSKSFVLAVLENQVPTVAEQVADINLNVDVDRDVELSSVFADESNDVHTYTASSSDSSIVAASVDESTLTLTGKSEGTGQITITVYDAADNAAQTRFWVHVNVNEPPTVSQEIADLETRVGRVAEISLVDHFQDEGDNLTFEVEVDDTTLVEATLQTSADLLRIRALAEGETTCSVTATDSAGESVSDGFAITILEKNDPPIVTRQLEDIEISLASHVRFDVDIEGLFDDEKPNQLDIDVEASTEKYADVILRNNKKVIRIYPLRRGDFEVTVTATDDIEQSTSTDFHVAVLDEEINTPPKVRNPVADQTIYVGDDIEINLANVYTDAENDELSFSAESDDEDVATVSLDDSNTLTVNGLAAGTAHITTEATDPSGESATDTFKVTVKTAPVASQTVTQITLQLGGGGSSLDLSESFHDADGDPLSFKITRQDNSAADVYIEREVLSMSPVERGTTVVSVVATDPDGNWAKGVFMVVVSDDAIMSVAHNALAGYGRSLLSSITSTIGDRDARRESGEDESLRQLWKVLSYGSEVRSFSALRPNGFRQTETALTNESWNSPRLGFTQNSLASATWSNYSDQSSVQRPGRPVRLWSSHDSSTFGGDGFDGNATNRYLGIDLNSSTSGHWGFALLESDSENSYTFGTETEQLRTALHSVIPYFRQQLGTNSHVWGALGYGKGKVTTRGAEKEIGSNQLIMRLGVFGIHRALAESTTHQIAMQAELGSLGLVAKGSGPAHGLQTHSHRVRIALNGSVTKTIGETSSITPFGRFGMRYSDGDNPRAAGWELGGGLKFNTSSLDVEARGHLFKVPAADRLFERGLSLTATYDKHKDGLGLTLNLVPSIGCLPAKGGFGWFGTENFQPHRQSPGSCNNQRALETTLAHSSFNSNGRVKFIPRTTIRTTSFGIVETILGFGVEYQSPRKLNGSLDVQLGKFDSVYQAGKPKLNATGTIYF